MTTVLREELSHRKWAQADLARVLNWPVQTMSEIMQGKRRVDAAMALDLAALTKIAQEVGPTPEKLNQDPTLRTAPGAIREARWWFDDYGMEWPG